MKIKGKRLIIMLTCAMVMCSGILFVPQQEVCAKTNSEEEIMPLADIIVWKYKIVNGVLYKRQYNQTKKCWVGNWIKD